MGFGEDISIKIEKQFLLKSATTGFRSCGFQVQNPKGKSNPLEIENFGTCTNILSDRANFATNVQAQSKIHHHL